MVIRRARHDDAAQLAAFAEHAFRDAFAADNSARDMDAYCAASFSVTALESALHDASSDTLVCVDAGDRIVAYAQLRPGEPKGVERRPAWELSRFYVDRSHHGRGVAQNLMTAVIATARARHARTLWLGVWEHNLKAQAFYRKCGFVDVGSQLFVLGTDVQTDRVMTLDITPGG